MLALQLKSETTCFTFGAAAQRPETDAAYAGNVEAPRVDRCRRWETNLVEKLPKELKGSLPTVEEIEAELAEYPQSAHSAPRRKR